MTKLVSSICVFPSQERERKAKADSDRALAQSRLTAEIAAQASVMGVSFAEARTAILRVLAQSPSLKPIGADVAKLLAKLKFTKPNSLFDPPLVWTHPSDTINSPSAKR